MTAPQIIDLYQSIEEGGLAININRFDDAFVLALLDEGRSLWLIDMYKTSPRLPAIAYQKFYPEFSLPLQTGDVCVKKFLMPDIIRLDEHSDGIRYAGEDDYDNDNTNNFSRIQSRAWKSTYKNHPVMNPARFFSFLYDGANKTLEFSGKASMVEAPLMECLFKHPTEIPTFNYDLDDYPLSLDGIYAVKKMITMSDTRLAEMTSPKPAFSQPQQIK